MWITSQRIEYKGLQFDSKLEFYFYQVFERTVENKTSLKIQREWPIQIKPKTGTFPAIDWKIDFRIWSPMTGKQLLIECKTVPTEAFTLRLKMFENENPDYFYDLVFYTYQDQVDRLKRFKRPVLTCRDFTSFLITYFKDELK